MKKYNAKLINLSEIFEEEVTIKMYNLIIVGFSTISPYKLCIGKTYPVELGLTFLDAQEIDVINEERYGLKRIGDTYQYIIYGKVTNSSVY